MWLHGSPMSIENVIALKGSIGATYEFAWELRWLPNNFNALIRDKITQFSVSAYLFITFTTARNLKLII